MNKLIQEIVKWAAFLNRLKSAPTNLAKKAVRSGTNTEQECARRRRFFERYGTAIGGGPTWDQEKARHG